MKTDCCVCRRPAGRHTGVPPDVRPEASGAGDRRQRRTQSSRGDRDGGQERGGGGGRQLVGAGARPRTARPVPRHAPPGAASRLRRLDVQAILLVLLEVTALGCCRRLEMIGRIETEKLIFPRSKREQIGLMCCVRAAIRTYGSREPPMYSHWLSMRQVVRTSYRPR